MDKVYQLIAATHVNEMHNLAELTKKNKSAYFIGITRLMNAKALRLQADNAPLATSECAGYAQEMLYPAL